MLNLRKIREEKGISQTAAAKALNISRQSYNFYENGKRDPDTNTLIALAKFFGVTTDYLLGIDESDLEKEKAIDEAMTLYEQLSPEDKEKAKAFIEFVASNTK